MCECAKHIQREGPEIVEEENEIFPKKVFAFDFPMQFPLAFTEKCLLDTKYAARNSMNEEENIKKIDELVNILLNKS